MKIINLRFAFFASLLILTFIACKKKSDDEPEPVKTRTQLLTGTNWYYTNLSADPPYDTLVNWSQVPTCEKDNFLSFGTDGSGSINENKNVCDGIPAIQAFTWSWLNDEKDLEIIRGNDTLVYYDVNVSSSSLVLRKVLYSIPGDKTYYLIYSYSKK